MELKNQYIYTRGEANLPMCISDIFSVMPEECNLIVKVDTRDFYSEDAEWDEPMYEHICSLNNHLNGKVLICAIAYASKDQYPESKYYDPLDSNISDEEKSDKEPLPLDFILNDESEKIKHVSANFKSVNEFCHMEYTIPFIWTGNKLGKLTYDEAIRVSKIKL